MDMIKLDPMVTYFPALRRQILAQSAPRSRKSGFISLLALLAAGAQLALAQTAVALPNTINLAPHRAVYEMALGKARSGSGVSAIRGRMVFEFTGSACEGYTLNMRMVTQIFDKKGQPTLSDLRSSSWEQGDGRRFQFNTTQYTNQKLGDKTRGDVLRANSGAPVTLNLKVPRKAKIDLPKNVVFPTQHSKLLLETARQGKSILQAKLYDGGDRGKKFYNTTAFIGKPHSPGNDPALRKIENGERLLALPSWPVSISYFSKKQIGEAVPEYELGFQLYENGVSRNLLIDYGSFAIRGALTKLEFLKTSACPEAAKPRRPKRR